MKSVKTNLINKLPLCGLMFLIIAGGGCASKYTHLKQGELYQEEAQRLFEQSREEYQSALNDPEQASQARVKLAEVYFQEGKYEKSIDLLKGQEDVSPAGLRILAFAHYRLNQNPQARLIFERLEELESKNIEAQYYLGLIKEKQNVFDQAVEQYKKIIKEFPDSEYAEKSRRHLAEIEVKGQRLTLEALEDSEIKTLIKQAPKSEDYPNAGTAILLDEVTNVIHADHTQTTTLHKLIKILDDRGKGFGEVELGFDSTYQTVKVDFARTIKTDGSIVPVGKKAWRELSPWSGFPLYSNAKVLVISMPEVVVGSIIEYQATISSSHLITDGDFQVAKSLQSHEPKLIQRMALTIPKDRSWKGKFLRMDELPAKIEEEGDNKTYRWELKDVKQILPEPMMPPWADIIPYMMVSSFDSWEEISTWFNELAKDQLKPDEAIRSKVAELIKGKDNLHDKAREIFHWVASQVRYVGLEYGVSGFKPHAVAEIFKNKYGDCKDQSSLLVSMLREAGVKAYLVLISTQDNGRMVKEIPMLQFNHCIVAAQIDDELVWLDPTYETCTYGFLPSSDQDRETFVFYDDGARFVKTPFLGVDINKKVENSCLTIKVNGDVEGKSEVITDGKYNLGYRQLKYVQPVKRKEMLQKIVNGMYPGGKLVDYSFSDMEDLNNPVEISMEYSGPNYLKKADNLRIFKLPGVGSSASMVGIEKRTYPIFFDSTSWDENNTVVKIPKEYKVKHLPQNLELELPYVSYTSKYELVDENIIKHQEVYQIKEQEIPVSAYQEYKEFREKIAKVAEESIILEER